MLYPINPPFQEVWVEFPYRSYPMIARHYMVYIPNCNMRRLVQNIKSGHCWKHISSKYDMSNVNTITYTLNENEIRAICEYMQNNGRSSTAHELLSIVGLDYNSMDKSTKSRYASFISSLRNKKIFMDICNEYNY